MPRMNLRESCRLFEWDTQWVDNFQRFLSYLQVKCILFRTILAGEVQNRPIIRKSDDSGYSPWLQTWKFINLNIIKIKFSQHSKYILFSKNQVKFSLIRIMQQKSGFSAKFRYCRTTLTNILVYISLLDCKEIVMSLVTAVL